MFLAIDNTNKCYFVALSLAITSTDHLHEVTKILPVQDHLSLITTQYLTRALQPNNPSHNVVTSPSCSRNMIHTLQYPFLHCVLHCPFILELLPFPSLFYLLIMSFRLLPRKLLRKKQTSLGPTEESFHNFVLLPVIPSIPIVRGYDWSLSPSGSAPAVD